MDHSKIFENAKDINNKLCGSFDLKQALGRSDVHKNVTQSDQKAMATTAMGQAEAWRKSLPGLRNVL